MKALSSFLQWLVHDISLSLWVRHTNLEKERKNWYWFFLKLNSLCVCLCVHLFIFFSFFSLIFFCYFYFFFVGGSFWVFFFFKFSFFIYLLSLTWSKLRGQVISFARALPGQQDAGQVSVCPFASTLQTLSGVVNRNRNF